MFFFTYFLTFLFTLLTEGCGTGAIVNKKNLFSSFWTIQPFFLAVRNVCSLTRVLCTQFVTEMGCFCSCCARHGGGYVSWLFWTFQARGGRSVAVSLKVPPTHRPCPRPTVLFENHGQEVGGLIHCWQYGFDVCLWRVDRLFVTSRLPDESTGWRVDLWRVDCVTSWPGDELTVWRADWQPWQPAVFILFIIY